MPLATLLLEVEAREALTLAETALAQERSARTLVCAAQAMLWNGRFGDAYRLLCEAERLPGVTDQTSPVRKRLFDRWIAVEPASLAASAEGDPALAMAWTLGRGGSEDAELAVASLLNGVLSSSACLDLALRFASAGRSETSARLLEAAVQLDPKSLLARIELAHLRKSGGRHMDALVELDRVLAAAPGRRDARLLRASVLQAMGRFVEALEMFRALWVEAPHLPEVAANLGPLLTFVNDVRHSGVAFTRTASELNPQDQAMYGVVLLDRHYRRYGGPWDLAERHAESPRFARRVAIPIAATRAPGAGRMRIGNLSADLKKHAVARFLLPWIQHHDRELFEVFCYAANERLDETSRAIEGNVDVFRRVSHLDDRQLVEQIRADGVDVLVELGGFTGGSRLPALALRAAPMQVTYLGYPNTSGMQEVDFRLVDEVTDPTGEADGRCSERLLRLPGGAWCFAKAPDPIRPVPPCLENGVVTFACYNNLAKASPEYLAACAEIARRVPGARLRFKAKALMDPLVVAPLRERLLGLGLAPEQLIFSGWVGNELDAYADVDIALDSYPYNGTTTTCEGLWMGVPAVTIRGDSHVSRVGASLLSRVGLDDLVATSERQYIETAVALARDHARLVELRRTLRDTLRQSTLGDGARFARDFEAVIERGWATLGDAASSARLRPAPETYRVLGLSSRVRIAIPRNNVRAYERIYVEGLELDPALGVLARLADTETTVVELDTAEAADALRVCTNTMARVLAVSASDTSEHAIRESVARSGSRLEVRSPEQRRSDSLSGRVVVCCDVPERGIGWADGRPVVLLAASGDRSTASSADWVPLRPVPMLGAFVVDTSPSLGRVGWCAKSQLDELKADGWLIDEAQVDSEEIEFKAEDGYGVFNASRWLAVEPQVQRALRLWMYAHDTNHAPGRRLAALREARDRFHSAAERGSLASALALARIRIELGDADVRVLLASCVDRIAANEPLDFGMLVLDEGRDVWCPDVRRRIVASLWRAVERYGAVDDARRLRVLRDFGTLGIPCDRMTRALEVAEYAEAQRRLSARSADSPAGKEARPTA